MANHLTGLALACCMTGPHGGPETSMLDQRLYAMAAMRRTAFAAARIRRTAPALFSLSGTDSGALRDARTKLYPLASGITLLAGRLKGGLALDKPSGAAGDRYSARVAGIEMAIPVWDDIRLQTDFSAARMNRHLSIVPSGRHGAATLMERAAIGLASLSGPSLMLSYTSVAPSGHRNPIERMTELAGGAPLAGKGPGIEFVSRSATDERGKVQWHMSLAALQRPITDSALGVGSGSVADRSAEVGLRMAF